MGALVALHADLLTAQRNAIARDAEGFVTEIVDRRSLRTLDPWSDDEVRALGRMVGAFVRGELGPFDLDAPDQPMLGIVVVEHGGRRT